MTSSPPAADAPAPSLPELRREIDRIDAAMHALLMERGEIIDRLIAVKRSQETGSAFRPGREAAMMREIVARHRGILPVDIVESIWRVIIATFTHVQAPYAVHGDGSLGTSAMQDVARFHFGFVVPYRTHRDAGAVITAVADSRGDLGLVPAAAPGPWWHALEPPEAPKIIARLPFVDRADHPAGLVSFVVSKPIDETAAVSDVRLFSAPGAFSDAWAAAGGSVVARSGQSALVAVEARRGADGAPVPPDAWRPVGSHAASFKPSAETSP
jgi:chorismate mutase